MSPCHTSRSLSRANGRGRKTAGTHVVRSLVVAFRNGGPIASRLAFYTDPMARPARLVIPGQPHYVALRGGGRDPVAADDDDRAVLVDMLGRVAGDERAMAVHAYALLDDELQLLVTPQHGDALARAMKTLGGRYVRHYNQRHRRTGTLWEGRYRTTVVDPDVWLLPCLCHIDSTALRAGLVPGLLDWPWSSARHHLGAAACAWLSDHEVYWRLGNTPFEREHAFRNLLEAEETIASRRLATDLGRLQIIGEPDFVAAMEHSTGLTLTPRPRGRPSKGAQADIPSSSISVPNK